MSAEALSRSQIAEILEAYRTGVPVETICAHFEVNRATLYEARALYGEPYAPMVRSRATASREEELSLMKQAVAELLLDNAILRMHVQRRERY